MSTTMTVRLEVEVKHRLDLLPEATRRSKSFQAAEGIVACIANNGCQIGESASFTPGERSLTANGA